MTSLLSSVKCHCIFYDAISPKISMNNDLCKYTSTNFMLEDIKKKLIINIEKHLKDRC